MSLLYDRLKNLSIYRQSKEPTVFLATGISFAMLANSFAARAKSALFMLDTREIEHSGQWQEIQKSLSTCVELHIVTFVVDPLSGRTVFLFRSALVYANPTEIYPKSALCLKLNVFRVTYEAHPRRRRCTGGPVFSASKPQYYPDNKHAKGVGWSKTSLNLIRIPSVANLHWQPSGLEVVARLSVYLLVESSSPFSRSSERPGRKKSRRKKNKEEEEGRRREESGTFGASSGWSNYPTVSRSRAARAETPGNKTLSFKAEAKPMLSPGPPRDKDPN
ncbi:hypothetical protein EAG_12763 [Camponotus floridanus]|uniref:Uncharacterized protein n=1 Tax=Camponotus floridanus TaxID=104421 RepID=E2AZG5_CAMFO|nr:hypothetical protein EAG_12763 [Camponotus floridanus]